MGGSRLPFSGTRKREFPFRTSVVPEIGITARNTLKTMEKMEVRNAHRSLAQISEFGP